MRIFFFVSYSPSLEPCSRRSGRIYLLDESAATLDAFRLGLQKYNKKK